MKIGVIYFFIIVFANTIGSISGMGGGILIKPMMDAIGIHSLVEIAFYSCTAVLSMSIVSTCRQLKNPININIKLALFLSFGALIGGISGQYIFNQLLEFLPDDSAVQLIQIIINVSTLVFALIYTIKKWQSLELANVIFYFLVGVFLGFLASLLGIGGGSINVALLMFCFGIPIKEATVYSIITILFSQLSALITMGFTTGYDFFDLSLLLSIVPAAIIGGFLGAKLSGILSEKIVLKLYQLIIIAVIVLNICNGIMLN